MAPIMTGAKGPAILTWVRFHVDKEIVEIIRKGHHGVPAQMPDAELRQIACGRAKARRHQPCDGDGRLHRQPNCASAA